MAALFWTSARTSLPSGLPMPKGPYGNLTHVAAWAFLAILLARAFDSRGRRAGLGEAAGRAALAVAALYGIFDEVHQFFSPGRTCSLFDAVLDSLGAAGALLLPSLRPPPGRSWAPALACFAAAAALAIWTGIVRIGPDRAIEAALLALGFSRV
jgi:VanZ like family